MPSFINDEFGVSSIRFATSNRTLARRPRRHHQLIRRMTVALSAQVHAITLSKLRPRLINVKAWSINLTSKSTFNLIARLMYAKSNRFLSLLHFLRCRYEFQGGS